MQHSNSTVAEDQTQIESEQQPTQNPPVGGNKDIIEESEAEEQEPEDEPHDFFNLAEKSPPTPDNSVLEKTIRPGEEIDYNSEGENTPSTDGVITSEEETRQCANKNKPKKPKKIKSRTGQTAIIARRFEGRHLTEAEFFGRNISSPNKRNNSDRSPTTLVENTARRQLLKK